jgi:pimeloyl-ACP methyl ester carboxylesterase
VIVATHGIGPARAHWNSPFRPKDFNFVEYAVDKGYSVFFYDRLGCGASTKYVLTSSPFPTCYFL